MINRSVAGLLGLAVLGAGACEEQTPTSVDEALIPGEAVTVEVRLDWDQFASGLEVLGGYGAPWELGTGVVAHDFADSLEARTLVRFGGYPVRTAVQDTTGTTVSDSVLTFIGGRLVARFDTIESTNEGPVTVAVSATRNEWHMRTVTWETAVDTINDRRAWPEPGAGPVLPLTTAEWDPADGDSVIFELDSAQVALWSDSTDSSRGVRVDLLTEGHRLKLDNLLLRLDTRPSANPDTLLSLSVLRQDLTFVYAPFPEPPPEGIRAGGVPAWRTVLGVDVPDLLDGPEELCAAVGCPVELTAERVSYAGLVLRSRATPRAFQPTDTVGLDVRPVLLRSALPKAPLGNSLVGLPGHRVSPTAFGAEQGTEVEIPVTSFVRNLLRGETSDGLAPPRTLALLSVVEPVSIAFASFHGPGGPEAPVLRLIVTAGQKVELP